MLFVGLYRIERARDREFWAVFWQGPKPPDDFRLIVAYNLLTDLRVIVFEAKSIASIRRLDRLNLAGRPECFPALDQTEGYRSVVTRDLGSFARFMRNRGTPEDAVQRAIAFRRQAMESPDLWAALDHGRARDSGGE